MSTERELTPGGPTEYHTISFADLAATLQLNGGISLIGKAFGKLFFLINLNTKKKNLLTKNLNEFSNHFPFTNKIINRACVTNENYF